MMDGTCYVLIGALIAGLLFAVWTLCRISAWSDEALGYKESQVDENGIPW